MHFCPAAGKRAPASSYLCQRSGKGLVDHIGTPFKPYVIGMQKVCRWLSLVVRPQRTVAEQAASSTEHWSPVIEWPVSSSARAAYHSSSGRLSAGKNNSDRLLSDKDGWERLVEFHRREVPKERTPAGKAHLRRQDGSDTQLSPVDSSLNNAELAEASVHDAEVSFSQLVAGEEARLPGYCAPVFPQEDNVAPVPKGRLTNRTLPDWQPYSQMARLVASRYGPELDIQRLFSPADSSAHGTNASAHSVAYFSDNRFPSALVRYLLRLDLDTHALPDLHQHTMPNGTTFTATHAQDRRDFLRLCGGRTALDTLEARDTPIDTVARAPLPDTPHFRHAQEVCRMIKTLGVPALLAGGAVRDLLLGLEPTDYDVAAGAGTAALLALFPGSRQLRNTVGTVEVPAAHTGTKVEVTPLRNFGPASASCFWSINRARDAAGRDFSVNSLMMDPHTGDVFDCNGGLRHLRHWLLAPASMATTSLTDDPIRCLRMLRFAARYGFSIDRTLALTAARLASGRLLAPPSNLTYTRASRWHSSASAVTLDVQMLPEPSEDPRMTLDLNLPPGLQRPRPPASPPRLRQPEATAGVQGRDGALAPPRDPRTPPVLPQDMAHLAPEFVGEQSRTLQLRREMVVEAHPSVISTWPAHMMAHEVAKLVTQDRVLPGALADAVQLALASGVAGTTLQLPVLEVAGAIDDRRILHGEPSLKRPIAAGWHCAVERLARMPPQLAGDHKLLTLLLGRTVAGVANIQPHAWLLYAPASAARRFDMFRTSLLFHRVLFSPEYLDMIGLPEAPPRSGRRPPASPSDELDAIIDATAGDFRTLLAFERSAAARNGGDAEACPYFRSLRRGGGHIMWNLTYGPFGAGKLLDPPLTPRPAGRTAQQQRDIDAGKWDTRWPLRKADAAPWTHRVSQPGLPLTELRALADLPEPGIPLKTALHTTFFRQALLRASAGCRVAAQARTLALIERAGHYHRVQLALASGKGTAEAADLAALDHAAAELMGDDGMHDAQLAMQRYERATRAMHDRGMHADDGSVDVFGAPLDDAEAGDAVGPRGSAGGASGSASAPRARMMHGVHTHGKHMSGLGHGGDAQHEPLGGQWRAGSSGSGGTAGSIGVNGAGANEHAIREQQGGRGGGAGVSTALRNVAATCGAGPEIRAGPYGARHRPGGAAGGERVGWERQGGVYSGVRCRTGAADGGPDEEPAMHVPHDAVAGLGPTADAAEPDGLTLSPDQGGISAALRTISAPSEPQPAHNRSQRLRHRPAATPREASVPAAADESWDADTEVELGEGRPEAAEGRGARAAAGAAAVGVEEGVTGGLQEHAQGSPGWKPRHLQEGAFAAEMREELSASAIWRRSQTRLAAPHSRRDRTMRHAFPQHATGFHALLNMWTGWDRLRYRPPAAATSPANDPVLWGLPESQIKQLFFTGKDATLDTLANLLATAEARADFRRVMRGVKRRHASELHARASVRDWVLCHASALLRPFGGGYDWHLPEECDRLDLSRRRMDERRFTLDLAVALIQARVWDEPQLMGSMHAAREAVAEMVPVHEALAHALTRSHLFDQHGALVPFVFAAELTALARVRARFSGTFPVPDFPRARIGDDLRRERQKLMHAAAASPGDRIMIEALTGPDAGSPLVPDEVVREAWARCAPWMHVSLPDWWAFKVWDRDMWIRTDTSADVYEDRFRPGEQLYGACVRPTSPRLQEQRDQQEHAVRRSSDAAAQHARRAQQKRLQRFWAQQDEYLSAEAGGEKVPQPEAAAAAQPPAAQDDSMWEGGGGNVWETT
eukprot:jgi/Ulvmu1/7948/UM004_0181.1